jgi:hypothetical protein
MEIASAYDGMVTFYGKLGALSAAGRFGLACRVGAIIHGYPFAELPVNAAAKSI